MYSHDDRSYDRSRGRRRGEFGTGRGGSEFWTSGGPGNRGGVGPWGVDSLFGPDGIFGPDGPFGADGPFGGGRRRGGPGGPGPGAGGPGGGWGPGGPGGWGGPGGRGRGRRHGGRARRGDVRAATLFLLAEQPMNGYQIIQTLADRTDGVWRPSPGSVYPVLSQLEDEGLIEPFDDEGRKAFTLTDAGRDEVEAAGDRPRPWEFARPQSEPGSDWEPIGRMWKEYAQVAVALKGVTQAGSPDLVAAATDLLAETRRSTYRLLAEAGADDVQDEVADDYDDDIQDDVPPRH